MIIIAAAVVFMFGMRLLKKWQLHRAKSAVADSEALSARNGVPQIVYFWSNQCNECKAVQKPILDRLLSTLGNGKIGYLSINVNEAPEEVKSWGVKTVPTTYVLDKDGNVLHVNNGIATERRLFEQLSYKH